MWLACLAYCCCVCLVAILDVGAGLGLVWFDFVGCLIMGWWRLSLDSVVLAVAFDSGAAGVVAMQGVGGGWGCGWFGAFMGCGWGVVLWIVFVMCLGGFADCG